MTNKAEIYTSLGLTDDEYKLIIGNLNREPNDLELAMFSVMWSEHCSYKSSRIHLKRLPTQGENVLVGPGENAGVIDVGDNLAIALRIESHNHPSAIEPTQGAATGAGGILRDIFTMGARPIALMDPLYVGPLNHPRHRWHLEGIVRGISNYGNSVGVPTVGGEIHFDSCYSGNPLVNVACVGVLEKDKLVLGQASGIGNRAILLGSTTGRDGIGGVSVLASASFDTDSSDTEKLPSVQVGDPYEEKRLIEACLELIEKGLAVGIQDLGGAGLTCATSETAARADLGMDVDISKVHLRETDMTPIEIMTSESQERMLAIVTEDNMDEVLKIAKKWEITASVIGIVTAPIDSVGYLRIFNGYENEPIAVTPAKSLADEAPLYDRPKSEPKVQEVMFPSELNFGISNEQNNVSDQAEKSTGKNSNLNIDIKSDLFNMLLKPEWIFKQYDHQLFLNTIVSPGNGAAVLRLAAPGIKKTDKAISLTTDGNPKWCAVNPYYGTYLTTVEALTNIAITGSVPQAIINCLNFGSPENPEVMWQFSQSIDGLKAACEDFMVPVVGGNVSFYNSTDNIDIDPTPVIGAIGLHPNISKIIKISDELLDDNKEFEFYVVNGPDILLQDKAFSLSGSIWATQLHGYNGGILPTIDTEQTKNFLKNIAEIVRNPDLGIVQIEDIGQGGLLLALAEMLIRFNELKSSKQQLLSDPQKIDESSTKLKLDGILGVRLIETLSINSLFSELPGRAIVQVTKENSQSFEDTLKLNSVRYYPLGSSKPDKIIINNEANVDVKEMIEHFRNSLSGYMS